MRTFSKDREHLENLVFLSLYMCLCVCWMCLHAYSLFVSWINMNMWFRKSREAHFCFLRSPNMQWWKSFSRKEEWISDRYLPKNASFSSGNLRFYLSRDHEYTPFPLWRAAWHLGIIISLSGRSFSWSRLLVSFLSMNERNNVLAGFPGQPIGLA